MDKIKMRGLTFYGFHGVFAEETRLGQRFIVHLALHLDLHDAGQSDDVGNTVNYAEVYEEVKRIVEGPPLKLIEAVAEHIARQLLERHRRLKGVTVEVEKPSAPIPGAFESVSVVVERFA